ncbi:MAG: hypothetical protein NTX38_08730 [Methylobacter sp.]|nr:hypothetical protein [Methylobacter sp.]
MEFKKTLPLVITRMLSGITMAQAEVVTFSNVTVTGCHTCTAIDPSNLKIEAIGHPVYGYPTGWDVWTSAAEHLVIVNGIGADFSVPNATFDLTKLKMLGNSTRVKTVVPLTYNLVAYHHNNPVPDIIPFTIPARVVSAVDFSSYPQLKNLDKVSISFPATSYIGKTYFIETQFTHH